MKYKIKILSSIVFSVLAFIIISPGLTVHASEEIPITTNCEMISGETTSTDIAITNTDTVEHTYTLSYDSLPSDFNGYFKQNNTVVDTVTIHASESDILTFSIDVPTDTATKSLSVPLLFTRDDGVTDTFMITYTLNLDYAVTISNNVTLLKATNGDTINLDVGVTNTGTKDLNGLTLTIDAPYKWVTESVTPETIDLKAGETLGYKVSLIIPTSGQAGEYPIKLTCSNEQITSNELSVPVVVSTNIQYFWWITGIIAALIAFTLLYFKKHGRR